MKLPSLPKFLARKVVRRVAIAVLCATSIAGVLAQAPFDPALERQLWKTLLPMGGDLAIAGPDFVPVPRRVSVNTPSPFKNYSWTDETGTDIYVSQTVPSSMPGNTPEEQAENAYNAEVDLLRDGDGSLAGNEGACTFSHRDDWDGDGPQWRQCVTGGRMLPPPPGALLDPVGLAVDGTTVYVVDDQNQRVQAFDFDGRVKPMMFPIGNGIPGNGTYSYSSYLPYAAFPGYESFNGGYSGSQLKAPNGIAVDASHHLAIADSGNHRIAMFANDGSPLFQMPLPDQLGRQFKPTLVAVTPGATALAPGSPIPAGHESDRIVVTDWSHCMVQIYRSNFDLVKTLPEALPTDSIHDACKNGDPTVSFPNGTPTFAGEFSTVTGVTIDQAGHIYVTDHAQNVVQVFDVDGNTLGWIGKPGVQAAPGEIQGPVGVAIDHLGRLGVIDAGNSRVVFYTVSYSPENVPTATFEFQLDTVVSVGDFPMGLAEQWGPSASGLDPKGRFVATDPWGKQILRFELPELAVVDAQAAVLAQQPDGQPDGQLTGRGTFKVAVPRQKDSDVIDVETFVTPIESGVSLVPGSITPSNDEVPGIDIGPGEYVGYQFLYTTNADVTQATFEITAHGDFDGTTYLAEAPTAVARSRATCTACDAMHEVYWLNQNLTPGLASPISNPSTGDWYKAGVFVRLLPIPADGSVTSIGWSYSGASSIFYTQHGEPQETALGANGYVDVPVGVSGKTTLTYWAVTNEGSIGAPHVVDLQVDTTEPGAAFLIWPPYTGTGETDGRLWYNHDVTAGYTASDAYSGTDQDVQANPALADGELTFTSEGRDQSQNVTVTDRVGHQATFNSRTASGGRNVNIDKVAPVFDQAPPNPIVIHVTGEDADGSYATVHPDAFIVTASDPNLGNGELGSGVASVTKPGGLVFRYGVPNTFTYTATDHAGNATSITVDVVVVQDAAALGAPSQSVGYGGRLILRANVTPRTATGTVTFAFANYTVTAPVQTVSGGIDPATGQLRVKGEAVAIVDPVLSDVAIYPMMVSYGGDNLNQPATYSDATVQVFQRTLTITANGAIKYYGDPDPAFTFATAGLINGDQAQIVIARTTGLSLGDYPMFLQSIVVSPNYRPVFETASLRIIGKATITPRPQEITYGDAEPAFTFDVSPLPPGGVLSMQPVCGVTGAHAQFGSYAITCAGATGNFLEFTYGTAQLTVNRRPAALVAGGGTKVFGTADPALTTTQTGILAADLSGITLKTTRAAGESVGSYATTASAAGGAANNYAFTATPGVFTITSAPPALIATGSTTTYDGLTHAGVCSAVGGDGASLPVTATYLPGPGAPRNAGTYTLTCAFAGDANNDPITATATIQINARPITISATSVSKVYGDADPALAYTLSGTLAPGDSITGALARATGNNVGTYAIAQGTLAVSANYALTFNPGTLTISKRAATVTAQNASKVFGAIDPPLTATGTGFLATDGITLSATRAAGTAVGTYVITPAAGGAALPNYNVTYVNGVFTIISNNQPPVCTAAYGGEIWPPNHKKFYAAPINGVTDPEHQAISIVVTGIWQDEPIDSAGDGQFSPDGQGVGTATAWVRAERNGHQNKAAGDGRVYEILFRATDSKGASCDGSVFWTVPHDQGQRATAIDSGVRYDSTGVVPGTHDKTQIHQKSPTP
jgi:hypothetical protein